MAELKDKVEDSLNEARILVLGVQVLVGFQYEAAFEPRFERLSPMTQYSQLVGLALLLFALAWLMAPAPFHWLACYGRDTPAVLGFTTAAVGTALLPFAVVLALDLYAVGELLNSSFLGLGTAAVALGLALFLWYGWEWSDRRNKRFQDQELMSQAKGGSGGTPLSEKIKRVLLECRIVLPGAQALLGFQLVIVYMDAFDQLTGLLKYVHLCGLACIGLSMVLLMTPASYHRLVEHGEDTERFLKLAGRLLMVAMVFLALGTAIDFWVVVEKVSQSRTWGLLSAGGALVVFYGLWFGYTLYRREQMKAVSATRGG